VRDLVRNVQELRKKSGLNVTDRILMSLQGGDEETARAVHKFHKYIEGETLAKIVTDIPKEKPAGREELALDRELMILSIWKEN